MDEDKVKRSIELWDRYFTAALSGCTPHLVNWGPGKWDAEAVVQAAAAIAHLAAHEYVTEVQKIREENSFPPGDFFPN